LHQVVVCRGTSVHPQGGQRNAGIALHGLEYIIDLVGNGIQGSTDDVIFIDFSCGRGIEATLSRMLYSLLLCDWSCSL
jgi:hypothetical protein